MKIVTWKIPYTLKKEPSGIVMEMQDDEKTFVSEETVPDHRANEITNIAKELANENDLAKSIAKGTLLPNEDSSKGFIELKILS